MKYIAVFKKKIEKNKDKIAKLTTYEMGKPLSQSLKDVEWELDFIDYYIQNGLYWTPKFEQYGKM